MQEYVKWCLDGQKADARCDSVSIESRRIVIQGREGDMRIAIALLFVLTGAPEIFAADVCPVTQAPVPAFQPPSPYSPAPFGEHTFLFGSDDLWVSLPKQPWRGLRHKIFWWRPGFDGAKEPRPGLTLTMRPVNGNVTTSVDRPATNAQFGGEWSMLIGVDFPTAGCWEIKGSYGGHSVTFVASVTP
jgi:hypothetical protein